MEQTPTPTDRRVTELHETLLRMAKKEQARSNPLIPLRKQARGGKKNG